MPEEFSKEALLNRTSVRPRPSSSPSGLGTEVLLIPSAELSARVEVER